jgi:hypothetical protein
MQRISTSNINPKRFRCDIQSDMESQRLGWFSFGLLELIEDYALPRFLLSSDVSEARETPQWGERPMSSPWHIGTISGTISEYVIQLWDRLRLEGNSLSPQMERDHIIQTTIDIHRKRCIIIPDSDPTTQLSLACHVQSSGTHNPIMKQIEVANQHPNPTPQWDIPSKLVPRNQSVDAMEELKPKIECNIR